jgi:branched-chain amino acid transport system permease protein
VLLIAGIGLLIFFENLFILLFGTDVKVVDYITVAKGVTILGAIITKLQILMIAVSLALLYALFLFLYKNKYGITMRAIANNPELAASHFSTFQEEPNIRVSFFTFK